MYFFPHFLYIMCLYSGSFYTYLKRFQVGSRDYWKKMFVHRLFHKILLRNIPHRQSVLETDNLRETIINIWSVEIKKHG